MPQDGCVPNEVRGGGCYWGPDVTHEVLDRHNLQLLIRSHECKQDGYEFCHDRRVRVSYTTQILIHSQTHCANETGFIVLLMHKYPTYKQVSFRELVRKSNLFICPINIV